MAHASQRIDDDVIYNGETANIETPQAPGTIPSIDINVRLCISNNTSLSACVSHLYLLPIEKMLFAKSRELPMLPWCALAFK